MEDIEASSLTNITFQGRQYADDDKLKDIMDKISGSQALDFYTNLKLRGGGVIKKIGKKDREEAVSAQKQGVSGLHDAEGSCQGDRGADRHQSN